MITYLIHSSLLVAGISIYILLTYNLLGILSIF